MSGARNVFHRRAQQAILEYALLRWENAIVLAGTILLTAFFRRPFPWWPEWGWLASGALAFLVLAFTSLTNAETNAELVLQMFQRTLDLGEIRLPALRKKVDQALAYQRRIESQVRGRTSSVLWDRAEDTARQLHAWIGNVYDLALKLDAYQRDSMLELQRKETPQEIRELQKRLEREANPKVRTEVEAVLESRRLQLESLLALDERMQQAELQLEQTMAALATVDNQVRLIDTRSLEGGRAENLRQDIRSQVLRLDDLVSSIEEVYQGSGVTAR